MYYYLLESYMSENDVEIASDWVEQSLFKSDIIYVDVVICMLRGFELEFDMLIVREFIVSGLLSCREFESNDYIQLEHKV